MQNYQQTIYSQYSNSPRITQLITNINAYLDPQADIDAFYATVWNVASAVGFGLDIWGRIVGVVRVLQISTSKFFGFDEATTLSADPFNQSPFYSGTPATANYALSDDAFRQLIYAKALSNITDGSIPSLNQILLNLFPGRGNCYVINGANMTMQYHFAFLLTPVEVAIVSTSGVLPNPTGVTVTITQAGS